MPGPPARDTRSLLLKGAGLVAIAVVSGLLWFLIRHDSTPEEPVAQPPAQNTGQFQFTQVAGPEKTTDCAAKSYGKTHDFFQDNPCQSLVRALYTTESGGAKALVSVVVVGMPDSAKAKALKALTEKDGTGNVTDLVKDKTFAGKGTPSVSGSDAAYASKVEGTNTTIVLADFYAQHTDETLLKKIAADALRLSADLKG
ncbi:hypothetical protein [Amycolatopsis australiensis]|uniref:Uncharacterized protein n=1 Tax=Amycolatopsis australiensis TaxID=546364 RepID=A0A1K1RVQ3_9PSEU|nr:hypothetical protein [Amycolatopsis australiensis]SFW76177.1 hypothetical protein SAMN04489730_4072 [Amycolatopsis australiensis]